MRELRQIHLQHPASHFQVALLVSGRLLGSADLGVDSSVEEREYNVSGFSYQEVGRVIYISTLVLWYPRENQW